MKDYKRLTNTNLDEFNPRYAFCKSIDYLCKNSCDYQGCARKGGDCENYKQFIKMYNRLYELEDKIEQGLILELPCKVGDTVYRILPRCDNINKCSEFDQHICSRSNCDWHIRETKFALNMLNYIGDYYFTTKTEAEARLQEMRGKQ